MNQPIKIYEIPQKTISVQQLESTFVKHKNSKMYNV